MLDLQTIPGPYHRAAHSMGELLQLTAGYRPYVAVLPDQYAGSVAAGATLETRLNVPVGSLLWALSGTSKAAAGFSVQLTDQGSQKPLFSQATDYRNVTGQGSLSYKDCSGAVHTTASPLHILAKPMVVLAPGAVDVQITNLAAAANLLQLCLHFACPDSGAPHNAADQALMRDYALAARAVRDPGTPVTKSEPNMNHVPFNISAAGDNVIVAGSPGAAIAIYELDLWNVAVKTITLMDGATQLRGPWTSFPASAGTVYANTGKPHFVLTPGQSFIINLSAATGLSGFVRYRME
ncbi:MAG: hypothetical protein LAQ30_01595 [Acidobacteriia bacterium]|nr:hypothetical protein [Terriglobia bacterium]